MDPITIAMGLSQFVPQIVKWIAGDKAATVAQKAVDIAKAVTGKSTGDDALASLQANPDLVLKYREAVLDQQTTFETLAEKNAQEINQTMRVEATADHWPTYSWRPFIGFCFGALAAMTGVTVFAAYLAVMFFGRDAALLGSLPGMIGSEAAVMATMTPVLGIASWFRGKMQADSATANQDQRG